MPLLLIVLYSITLDQHCSSWKVFFFFKQMTAYEMRISDWSSDVCSSYLTGIGQGIALALAQAGADIAAAGRSPATGTVDQVRALGRKAENFHADLSSVAAVQPLIDAAQIGRAHV